MSVVFTGWIFFRASGFGGATTMLARILTWDTSGVRTLSPQILVALAVVAGTHLVVPKDSNWPQWIVARSMPVRIAAYTAFLLAILCFGARESAPFIYFQF